MNNNKDINRYAEAIFQTAYKFGDISEISLQLKSLLYLFKTCPEIRFFLESKRIDKSTKTKIIKNLFKNTLSDFCLGVLNQLHEDEMLLVIEKIINRVRTLIELKRDIINVEVSTVSSVSDNELKSLIIEIEKKLDKKVEVLNKVDPDMVGGVKLRISNTIIDGSIATRLKKLGELLYQ